MQQRIYFHTFDALRFIAFLRVFLLHLPAPEGNQFFHDYIFEGGEMGVDLFFVLSGFLITYLLTFEYKSTGMLNGKSYFMRRALRIWPLFFAGVAIAYINNFISGKLSLGTQEGYDPNPLFSLTFLENYRMIILDNYPNGAPLRVFWSLCVEEHFYLIWFLLFLVIPLKHFAKAAGLLWLTGIAYRCWFYIQFPHKEYYDIDLVSKLDFFCAGGLAGFAVAVKPEFLKRVLTNIPRSIRTGWIVLAIFFFLGHQLIWSGRLSALYLPIISAILLTGLILLIATSTTRLHIGKDHIFSKLGRISYGLYVYHTVIMTGTLALLKVAGMRPQTGIHYLLFGIATFAITVLISLFSYRYFEGYFLRLKKQFMVAGSNNR